VAENTCKTAQTHRTRMITEALGETVLVLCSLQGSDLLAGGDN